MQTAERVNNRYEVIRELGDGGFGKTFLVRDCQMPSARECVLKQLKPVNDNPQMYDMVKTRFQREAAILEHLGEHDQIPRLYAYFSEADRFYLVEEYVEGDTLTQKVHREGPQSEANIRSMLISLLPAMVHVHQQKIVHRDIKPDNIILRKVDGKPVLLDFGAVKETMTTVMNAQGQSTHSIVVGTPGYMPAEQLAGRPLYSSDLYSLGLTAVYMLTGKIPQEMDSCPDTGSILWRGFAPNVSAGFAEFIDRSIQMHPQMRFASAQEMFLALNALAIGMGMPPSVGVQPIQPQQHHSATVMSNVPMHQSSAQTQAVMPQQNFSTTMSAPQSGIQPKPGMSEWTKAMIMGSLVGAFVLGGLFITRPQQASTSEPAKVATTAAQPSEPAAAAKNQPVAPASTPSNTSAPAPVQQAPQQAPQAPQQAPQAAPQRSPVDAAPLSAPAQDSITASEARGVIENWFVAKRSMFGSSYSAGAAQAITTGILLNDITKPNGSIDWLRSNNAEYRFGAQRVDSVDRVVSNGDNATVAVTATEDRTLYKDGKVDPTQTDFKTKTTVYTLQRIGGAWKIADYKND